LKPSVSRIANDVSDGMNDRTPRRETDTGKVKEKRGRSSNPKNKTGNGLRGGGWGLHLWGNA